MEKFPNCSTLLYDARTLHCSPLHTCKTPITYPTSTVTETVRGTQTTVSYFLCAGSWSWSMNCARLAGRGHFIHAAAHDSASAPPRTSQPRTNLRSRSQQQVHILNCRCRHYLATLPSIIRYLMVTSRGDVGYNCNDYQSLLIFTHVNLLVCFIGPCADL